MKGADLQCWKCGAGLDEVPVPLSRRAVCPACDVDLHVCRMCRFHDRSAPDECLEPVADAVRDKERANFCGYLTPRPGAHTGTAGGGNAPPAALSDLFGLDSADTDDTRSEADRAREELEKLFGGGKPDRDPERDA